MTAPKCAIRASFFIDASKLKREASEFFDFEWEGLKVFDQKNNLVGTVIRIEYTPLKQLVVKHDEQESLIPLVKEWILNLDLENESLTMDLPEGLVS